MGGRASPVTQILYMVHSYFCSVCLAKLWWCLNFFSLNWSWSGSSWFKGVHSLSVFSRVYLVNAHWSTHRITFTNCFHSTSTLFYLFIYFAKTEDGTCKMMVRLRYFHCFYTVVHIHTLASDGFLLFDDIVHVKCIVLIKKIIFE